MLRISSFLIVLLLFSPNNLPAQSPSWTSVGQGLTNLRSQPAETKISTANVSKLAVKWTFTTGGDTYATPTVSNGAVYFPDQAGNLYAVNAATGAQIWTHTITSYVGMANAISRGSPAIYNNSLIVGDNVSVGTAHSGAHVIAVKTSDGSLLWKTTVDSHPAAIITGSPIVYNDVAYVTVSSVEETLAKTSSYACCTFRGSLVALNAVTGKILWQTYMTPSNNGTAGEYSGGSIWSPAAIDVGRSLVYVTTGNNYSTPASVQACEQANIANNTTKTCTTSTDYFDSMVAINVSTGAVVWAHRLSVYDTFNLACHASPPGANCPDPEGDDYDFGGGGPNVFPNLVGAGRKSGYYDTFNPAAGGAYKWQKNAGPAGSLGGILWGTASDGARIFLAIGNSSQTSFRLASGKTITYGFWTALDAATGKTVWQTPEPTAGTSAITSVSTANGVVYFGSLDAAGHMYAVDAATGKVLWSFASGGSVQGAPAIVDGVLYWGSGYKRFGGTGNNKLYAFSVP